MYEKLGSSIYIIIFLTMGRDIRSMPERDKLKDFDINIVEVWDQIVWHTKRIFDDIIDDEAFYRYKVLKISSNKKYIKTESLIWYRDVEIFKVPDLKCSRYDTSSYCYHILKKSDIYKEKRREIFTL